MCNQCQAREHAAGVKREKNLQPEPFALKCSWFLAREICIRCQTREKLAAGAIRVKNAAGFLRGKYAFGAKRGNQTRTKSPL